MEISKGFLKTAERLKSNERGIELDPNSWSHAEWWYEDEPEVYDFMMENESTIKGYAVEQEITIKEAIDTLFKNNHKKDV